MKKLVSLFCLFVYFFNISVFASEIKDYDYFAKNYNLNAKQVEVVERITGKYSKNTDIADKILSMNLLDDFKSSSIYYWDEDAMKLYYILKCNSQKTLTKSQIKEIYGKNFGKDYYIYLNGKIYNGISKINISDISKNDEIYIAYHSLGHTKKRFKNQVGLKRKYNLDNETLRNALNYTNDYKNTKVVEPAFQDNLFDEFYKCMGVYSWTSYYNMNEDKFFEKAYPVFKNLYQSKRYSQKEIKDLTINFTSAVRIDDNYYKNFAEVTSEQLANADKVYFYEKDKFKNSENFKKYLDFQREYNLDDKIMDYVWNDTKRLRKNKKIVEKALADGTFADFHRHYDNSNFSRNYNKFFKTDYYSYLQLKEAGYFSEKQIKKVLTQNGYPCISFTPRYWGKNDQKIKKVLKNDKIKKDDKYSEIIKRISYRKVNALDLVEDAADLVTFTVVSLSGIGLLFLLAAENPTGSSWFTLPAVKFK